MTRQLTKSIEFSSVPDPWHFGVDPDPRIYASDWWIRIRIRILDPDPAGFVIDLQGANKKLSFYFIFSAYYFLKIHLHLFSKIKSQKKSQNSRNQGFSYYFCMMIEESRRPCGSGGSGLGSGTLEFSQDYLCDLHAWRSRAQPPMSERLMSWPAILAAWACQTSSQSRYS